MNQQRRLCYTQELLYYPSSELPELSHDLLMAAYALCL